VRRRRRARGDGGAGRERAARPGSSRRSTRCRSRPSTASRTRR
jgi:hypothetical protein